MKNEKNFIKKDARQTASISPKLSYFKLNPHPTKFYGNPSKSSLLKLELFTLSLPKILSASCCLFFASLKSFLQSYLCLSSLLPTNPPTSWSPGDFNWQWRNQCYSKLARWCQEGGHRRICCPPKCLRPPGRTSGNYQRLSQTQLY